MAGISGAQGGESTSRSHTVPSRALGLVTVANVSGWALLVERVSRFCRRGLDGAAWSSRRKSRRRDQTSRRTDNAKLDGRG
jgi:hypothetical protein